MCELASSDPVLQQVLPQNCQVETEAQSRSGHPSLVLNNSRVPCSRSLLMSAWLMLLLTSPRLAEYCLSAGPPLISLSSRRRWGSTPSSHLILADAVGTGQKGRQGMKTCVLCWSLSYTTQQRPLCLLILWMRPATQFLLLKHSSHPKASCLARLPCPCFLAGESRP